MEEKNVVKGFKVFNPNWTCLDYQYEVGKIFEEDVTPECCKVGFHFCLKASDCFNYYSSNHDNKVAEVIALGEVDYSTEDSKCATNKIQIVREISWDEVQQIANFGKNCTGVCNTGNRNTGDWNTGNRNTGDCNTGDWNTGNRNTGNCNTGDWNTGNSNTGNRNTGNRNTGNSNTGNRNTGDWNKSSFNNGCFMTIEPKIMMFNKPSDWTYRDWLNSDAWYLLNQIPKDVVEWVNSSDMTAEEKEAHSTHECTGGYLNVLDESECGQLWWGSLSEHEKEVIKSLPNFDAVIFEEVTGVKTE